MTLMFVPPVSGAGLLNSAYRRPRPERARKRPDRVAGAGLL